uniref:Myomesin 1a (skelemin) n=1 Tax=Echeneis naucrates TaxID=173247 RepID=A0A665WT73_ECHNA
MLFLYLEPSEWEKAAYARCFSLKLISRCFGLFCCSHDVVRGLMESQEEATEEGINYVAMRNLFVREAKEALDVKVVKKSRSTHIRESVERMEFSRTHRKPTSDFDSLTHPPEFVIKPRGQTVWEGKTVKLHCTVAGWPKPRIAWYKNNVLIDAKAHPEKYTVESNYNMHSLEIKNCDFLDTAQYHASALNVKGEASCVATIVIKIMFSVPSADGFCPEHGVTFRTSIIDKFEVAFGREGETLSLGCTVIIYPTVKKYQPEVIWYRDSVPIKPSKWVHTHWSGERATLTLVHLNKEDEGMYTLRVNTKSGFDTYSAYVFVRDADVEVEGVPVAPLDVWCHDANKDYVVVTWKQPAVEGSSPILGYYIDRCEVGTHHWAQCNDTPVKYTRFPVTGLVEGRSYIFRVTALNKFGVSRPSRVSEAVVAMDPSDRARLPGPSAPWTGMIKFTEEDSTDSVVPGEPSDVVVTEATKSYVVLAWKPPVQRGHEGVMYYIEKCISGTDTWQRVNTGMPVKSPRFALFDLAEDKSYSFRVRCCNSAGVGEPSVSTGDITVGDKLDLPSAPGSPVATRNTDTSVVVSWAASKEVRHLVGYYIECSIVGTDVWMPCNNKPVKQTRFVCHGLTTEANYVFRVKAVNAAGYSQSSPDSDAVVVKAAICNLCTLFVAVPGKPTGVTLVEAVKDYMILAWTEAANNGGADVRGYFVDYRTVKGGIVGKWHEMNHKALTTTSYKAENLKENVFYQFQVRAMNMAGVSKASLPSAPLLCKEWTLTVPGAPVGLHVLEVRDNSVVVLWEPPVFDGRTPVNGYYLDLKVASSGEAGWKAVHEKANKMKYMKVAGLKGGTSYVFRVRAQNLVGVGKTSAVLGPIQAQTRPGTKEIYVDVDDDGIISMIFECSEMTGDSEFVWSKNYKAITDTSRLTIVNEKGKSRAIFNNPSLEDLGTFSCVVTNTDGISSSYTLTEEGLKRLLDISHEHKFPVIPFKNEMAIELLEKGRVRLWTQVEKWTADCQVDYVFNDVIVSAGQKYSMKFDKSTGIIEMFMDSLEVTDEGTFTFNLVDGKAKGTTSLVLIGDEFRELQKKSEFERAEWIRKQGPHFVEYLGFAVTQECDVLLKCKVRQNAKKIEKKDGDMTFNIGKVSSLDKGCTLLGISKSDAGIYEVYLKDDRGKDSSTFNMTDAANSSSEIKVLSTEHGIVLYSMVTHYNEDLRVGWLHKDAKIAASERVKSGVTGEQLWLKINEPTEKDKGKYTIDIFDGKDGVKRFFDLTGKDRARVVGGLPDVVAIQEGKSLNLTGNVWGEPVPEVSWSKNDKELLPDDHIKLKFEHGKFASITIAAVTTADSGKYALLVKNKFGTEAGEFTVSVYNPEDEEKEEEKKD